MTSNASADGGVRSSQFYAEGNTGPAPSSHPLKAGRLSRRSHQSPVRLQLTGHPKHEDVPWNGDCSSLRAMALTWLGFSGLFVIALVRRHGWEYVPIVVLIAFGRWYISGRPTGGSADLLALLSFAALWMIAKRTAAD